MKINSTQTFSPSFNGSIIIKGKKLIEKQNGKEFLPKLLDSESISNFKYGRNFIFSRLIIKPVKEGTIAWKINRWRELTVKELANNLSAPWQLSAKNRETLNPDFMRAYIRDYLTDNSDIEFAKTLHEHFSKQNILSLVRYNRFKSKEKPYTIFSAIKQIWNRPKKSRIDRIIDSYERNGQKLIAVRKYENSLSPEMAIEIETDKFIHRMPVNGPLDYYNKQRIFPNGLGISKESLENTKILNKYINSDEGLNTLPDIFWNA